MNHLGDTNKMISETPRTDAAEYESQDEPVEKLGAVDVDFARQLERELNAANKRLEEIEKSGVYEGRPIDKTYLTIHSDVLGTMVSEKAYDPQAKIRELQDRIKRLEEAGNKMDETADPFVLYAIEENSDDGPIPMSEVSEQYEITYDNPPTAGDHVAIERARKDWRKAKEKL